MNKVQIPSKTGMSKVDLIIQIVPFLFKEYKVAVSVLKDRLMDSSAQVKLMIKMAWKKIILCHDCVKKHEKEVLDEQAFAAYKPQYKPWCSKCSEYGHSQVKLGVLSHNLRERTEDTVCFAKILEILKVLMCKVQKFFCRMQFLS